jgi:hypothetical protein
VTVPADRDDRNLPAAPPGPPSHHASRLHLLWDLLAFQFKLACDGLRDLVLVPVSIGAVVLGLLAGGNDPYRYFRALLRFGHRSDIWINLFGGHDTPGTADDLIGDVRTRVAERASRTPWAQRVGTQLNETLDGMNAARRPPPADPSRPEHPQD